MEQKLTNQEIAKILAMYLGCECKGKYGTMIYTLQNVDLKASPLLKDKHGNECVIFDFKLLLTPLDRISDEDAIGACRSNYNLCFESPNTNNGWRVERKNDYRAFIEILNDKNEFSFCLDLITGDIMMYRNGEADPTGHHGQSFQYLISKGYDVPLYFSPNHWANEKTSIKLGIAIDSSK